jgi:hypothetical protein
MSTWAMQRGHLLIGGIEASVLLRAEVLGYCESKPTVHSRPFFIETSSDSPAHRRSDVVAD